MFVYLIALTGTYDVAAAYDDKFYLNEDLAKAECDKVNKKLGQELYHVITVRTEVKMPQRVIY